MELCFSQKLGWRSMRRFWPITCPAPLQWIKRDISTKRFSKQDKSKSQVRFLITLNKSLFFNPTSQKERTGNFQQRWFVLKANLLFYQERPADRHLLGVIVLEGCTVQRSESDQQFAFTLVFGPGLKTYRFLAADHRCQESWVTALFSARHCYLSQLVRDLGRKYEGEWGRFVFMMKGTRCKLKQTVKELFQTASKQMISKVTLNYIKCISNSIEGWPELNWRLYQRISQTKLKVILNYIKCYINRIKCCPEMHQIKFESYQRLYQAIL